MTLHDLAPGDEGIVLRLDLGTDLAQRLMSLGFVPGIRVSRGPQAPEGDPRVYRVDGAEVALRAETARRIEVERSAGEIR